MSSQKGMFIRSSGKQQQHAAKANWIWVVRYTPTLVPERLRKVLPCVLQMTVRALRNARSNMSTLPKGKGLRIRSAALKPRLANNHQGPAESCFLFLSVSGFVGFSVFAIYEL